MNNYLICVRNTERKNNAVEFGNEPGQASFLVVPEASTDFTPEHKEKSDKTWLVKLLAERPGLKHILFYVHGYNSSRKDTLARHKILKEKLAKQGWDGEVVTFAWPSGTQPLLYLEDRHDAKLTAMELVKKGIKFFVDQMQNGCLININVLAHSTGAYIIRESFSDAQTTRKTTENSWAVSQLVFISGDISSNSMETELSAPVYNHCQRLTNYFNPYDSILAISNVKRLGVENRVGRVGLPKGSPHKSVDVNCGDYYNKTGRNVAVPDGAQSHSWYFFDDKFYEDFAHTLKGDLDRDVIPSRELRSDGELYLRH